jgi:hypothetical protein
MQNFKKFLDALERKVLFPVGRRTWQIFAIGAILAVLIGALWYLANSVPASRVQVRINKWEVIENEIDTTSFVVESKGCTKEMVKSSLDSLQKRLYFLEWDSLGRFEERTYYVTDKYGNYIYNRNSWDYVKGKKRVFVPNEQAVPNRLNAIYEGRYIDSLDLCERKDLIATVYLLSGLYDPKFLASGTKFRDLCRQLEYNRNLDEAAVLNAQYINTLVDPSFRLIKDGETLERFYEILQFVLNSGISDEELILGDSVITAHRALGPTESANPDDYLEVLKIISSAKITNPKHLQRAIEDFNAEIAFYQDLGFLKSLRRYLELYYEKLEWAESQKMSQEQLKESNRKQAYDVIWMSLAAVGSITIILLLFSIQRQMRQSAGE